MFKCSDFWSSFTILLLFSLAGLSAKTSRTICGPHELQAGLTRKYLISPDWPLEYPSSIDCYYVIEPETNVGFVLELNWIEFNIKGDFANCVDFLDVSIGKEAEQKFTFCSSRLPHPIFSTRGRIKLHFHSHQKEAGNGFKASFQLVPYPKTSHLKSCGGRISSHIPTGIISSPEWPKLAYPCSCVFHFSLARNESLQLNVMDFSNTYNNTCASSQAYDNYVEIRVSTNEQFHRSIPVFSLSACQRMEKWSAVISRREIFVHVNILKVDITTRGFLAGYLIHQNKAAHEQRNQRTSSSMDVILIGVVSGVFIAVLIVFLIAMAVQACINAKML